MEADRFVARIKARPARPFRRHVVHHHDTLHEVRAATIPLKTMRVSVAVRQSSMRPRRDFTVLQRGLHDLPKSSIVRPDRMSFARRASNVRFNRRLSRCA